MYQILVRRVLLVIPTLLVVSVLSFAIMRAAPGDPVQMYVAGGMSQGSAEDIDRIRENLGLNDPLPVQYLRWLGQAVQGNLGYSLASQRPVIELISERLPASLSLMGISLVLSMAVGILIGVIAAVKQYSLFDYATTTFAVLGNSLPSFWIAMILIWLFAVRLGWLPTGPDAFVHAERSRLARHGQAFRPAGLRDRIRQSHLLGALPTRQHARGAASGLHPHRARQGCQRAAGHPAPCLAQLADPDRRR